MQGKISWTVLRMHHRYINNYGAIALVDVAKAGQINHYRPEASLRSA